MPYRRRFGYPIVLFVVLACAAVACSPTGATTTSDAQSITSQPPTAGPPSIWSRDSSAADPVIKVTYEGGLTTTGELRTRLPLLVMYADGSAVVRDSVAGVKPILLPLKRLSPTEAELERVNHLVGVMGLRDLDTAIDDSLRDQGVFDFGTTVATYFDDDGVPHTYGVYALEVGSGLGPAADALAELASMFEEVAGGEPVEPDRIQLFQTRVDTTGRATQPWPLDVVPDDFATSFNPDHPCLILTGSAADRAADILESTSRFVRFEHEDQKRWLLARILLPEEEGCGPELAGDSDSAGVHRSTEQIDCDEPHIDALTFDQYLEADAWVEYDLSGYQAAPIDRSPLRSGQLAGEYYELSFANAGIVYLGEAPTTVVVHGKRVAAIARATERGEQKSVLLGFQTSSLVAEPFASRSILIDELGDVEFVGTCASSRYRRALEVRAAEGRTTGRAYLEGRLMGEAESP